eukprot:6157932-Amphidinium_carterae.1
MILSSTQTGRNATLCAVCKALSARKIEPNTNKSSVLVRTDIVRQRRFMGLLQQPFLLRCYIKLGRP